MISLFFSLEHERKPYDGLLKGREIQIFMDALFQIIVPKIREIEGIEITQTYELDGVEYPREPKILSWHDISLSFDEKTQYRKFLPINYLDENWIWLKVSDETLEKYDISVKTEIEKGDERTLETFLRLFLKDLNRWVVAFILNYDDIDSVYQLEIEHCIIKLRNNLKRNVKTEGFIAYK